MNTYEKFGEAEQVSQTFGVVNSLQVVETMERTVSVELRTKILEILSVEPDIKKNRFYAKKKMFLQILRGIKSDRPRVILLNGERAKNYIENILCPTLNFGDIVVMNFSSQK